MYSNYKSKKSSKSKSKTRKSQTKVKKSRHTRKNHRYLKKLQMEEELSKNIVRSNARKTPVVSMSHGTKLLSKSKKQLRSGKIGNAMASLLTAVAVLSATGPISKHPNVKEQRMSGKYEGRWTGDPDELMKWHMDKMFDTSNKIKTRRHGKTVKRQQQKSSGKKSSGNKSKSKKSKSKKQKTRKNRS